MLFQSVIRCLSIRQKKKLHVFGNELLSVKSLRSLAMLWPLGRTPSLAVPLAVRFRVTLIFHFPAINAISDKGNSISRFRLRCTRATTQCSVSIVSWSLYTTAFHGRYQAETRLVHARSHERRMKNGRGRRASRSPLRESGRPGSKPSGNFLFCLKEFEMRANLGVLPQGMSLLLPLFSKCWDEV